MRRLRWRTASFIRCSACCCVLVSSAVVSWACASLNCFVAASKSCRQRSNARSSDSAALRTVRSSQSGRYHSASLSSLLHISRTRWPSSIHSRSRFSENSACPLTLSFKGRPGNCTLTSSSMDRSITRFSLANQTACIWARTRSSLETSIRGGRTNPATMSSRRWKKYWS